MESGETPFINQPEKTTQSNISKLAEELTGFKLDDSKIIDHLIDDNRKIGDKYGLPYVEQLLNNPEIYYKNIKSFLTHHNIPVVQNSNFDSYFKENPSVGAIYYSPDKCISINKEAVDNNLIDKENLLISITHESIHALQDKYNPDVSIEQKEYEAYVGSLPMTAIKKDSKSINIHNLFENILNSIEINTQQVS